MLCESSVSVKPQPPDQEVSAEALARELASTATGAQLGEWWLERAIPYLRATLLRVQAEARRDRDREWNIALEGGTAVPDEIAAAVCHAREQYEGAATARAYEQAEMIAWQAADELSRYAAEFGDEEPEARRQYRSQAGGARQVHDAIARARASQR
jgi:hypothetical protein